MNDALRDRRYGVPELELTKLMIDMNPGNTIAIEEMFNSISSKYDFLNDIFSFGLHRLWKRKLLDILNPIYGENG